MESMSLQSSTYGCGNAPEVKNSLLGGSAFEVVIDSLQGAMLICYSREIGEDVCAAPQHALSVWRATVRQLLRCNSDRYTSSFCARA